MELVRPPSLAAFFEYGGDLSGFPALEGLAEAVVQRRLNSERENRRRAAFSERCVDAWVEGRSTAFDRLPGGLEPSQVMVTAFAWQAECYRDRGMAERFEAALPPAMLAEQLEWVHERKARGSRRSDG